MRVPDNLIRAVAEALHVFTARGRCECGLETDRDPEMIRRHTAELALAAAFAALPGLADEEWADLVGAEGCCNDLWHGPDEVVHHRLGNPGWTGITE